MKISEIPPGAVLSIGSQETREMRPMTDIELAAHQDEKIEELLSSEVLKLQSGTGADSAVLRRDGVIIAAFGDFLN